jgi:SAM-dependent methyltransferase
VAHYDTIGIAYASTRRPDPRIEGQIISALGDATSVVNVGAGTGSYEPTDRRVVAVEPSAVMVAQRPSDAAPAVQAVAEALPFLDRSFEASMAVYTVHHWTDLERGLSELRRVARRRVLILMSDPRFERSFWLNERYFPELTELDEDRLPLPEDVLELVGGGSIITVPIPHDCRDGLCTAYWRRPEAYLDPGVRAGISYFWMMDPVAVDDGLRRLASELASGDWHERYGHLLQLEELDTGQRLVIAETRA